jgi:hypothetical protein
LLLQDKSIWIDLYTNKTIDLLPMEATVVVEIEIVEIIDAAIVFGSVVGE